MIPEEIFLGPNQSIDVYFAKTTHVSFALPPFSCPPHTRRALENITHEPPCSSLLSLCDPSDSLTVELRCHLLARKQLADARGCHLILWHCGNNLGYNPWAGANFDIYVKHKKTWKNLWGSVLWHSALSCCWSTCSPCGNWFVTWLPQFWSRSLLLAWKSTGR